MQKLISERFSIECRKAKTKETTMTFQIKESIASSQWELKIKKQAA